MSEFRARHLAAVAAGGAIGAPLRVGFAALFPLGAQPLAILAENVLGALLLGVMMALIHERLHRRRTVYLFVCTGILGSFTTFSNLSVEVATTAIEGHVIAALAYSAASVSLGLVAAFAGVALGRRMAPPRRPPG
jgi:fluoride exporter